MNRDAATTATPDPQRVETIFHAVLERSSEERDRFLDQACAGDVRLRARVSRLLQCFDLRGALLDAPPPGMLEDNPSVEEDAQPGRRIGPYELVRNLASGGMGTVWLARRADEQFEKQVALKLIKRGMDTDALLARFRTERQVLASLDHPNIARLLDGGVTDEGLPYLVMEYVDGVPIDRYCDQHRLTVPQRLQLFRTLSSAVQFAHQNLVVHRDLKPNNILVTSDGTPKLLDFGIAKVLHADGDLGFSETAPELRIMTPRYASPEQVRGERVSTATDVYSLGVVLYELLTGHEPYEISTRSRAEYERAICEQEPPRPSTAVARVVTVGNSSTHPSTLTPESVGAARCDHPRRLRRRLAGDLDMILLKALRKEPQRRYASVEQLSEDIRLHLSGLPIQARPDSWSYRARKLIARNKALVTAGGVAAAALIASAGMSIAFGRSEARQRVAAEESLRRAEEAEQWAKSERDTAGAERDKAVAIKDFLIQAMQAQDPTESGRQDILVSEAMRQAVDKLNRGELSEQPETVAALLDAAARILDHAGNSAEAERLASRALESRRLMRAGDNVDVAASLATVGLCLISLGRSAEALPLLESRLEMCQRLNPEDQTLIASGLTDLGYCLDSCGRAGEALDRYEKALGIYRKLHEQDHADVAAALNNVANALLASGRTADALPNYEAAGEMLRRLHGGDHPHVARNLSSTAQCLQTLGRSGEALPKFEEALKMYQRLYRGDHPSVGKCLTSLASCLKSLGRAADALPKYEAALAMLERLYPGDHPDVATCRNNVGACRSALGRRDEALQDYQAALEMRQRIFKGDHPDVALSLNNVAFCIQALGRYAEAIPQFQASLEMYQRLFKGDHPDIARGMNNVAFCLQALGRPAEALQQYEAVLAMYQRLFNGPNPNVARTLLNMAGCHQSLGQLPEALEKDEAALRMYQACFQGDHPDVAKAMNQVAFAQQALGKPEAALSQFEATLEMYRRLYKGDHPDVAMSINNVGYCLGALERMEEALPQFEAALEMRQRLFSKDHPDLAASLNNIATCQLALNRPAEALPKAEAALEMRQRLFKRDHPDVAQSLNNLAACLIALGRPADALTKSRAALEMGERVLPADHVDIHVFRIGVGVALVELQQYGEAEPLLLNALVALEGKPGVRPVHVRNAMDSLANLYEAKHTVEPGNGYDAEAAQWRRKLLESQTLSVRPK